MSRRTQVVRTSTAAGPSEEVTIEGPFSWNAMVTSELTDEVAPDATQNLTTNWAWHVTTETDLDRTFDPYVNIVIPQDGIYSVSARVSVSASVSSLAGLVGLDAHTDSFAGTVIDGEMRPLTTFDSSTVFSWLNIAHVGFPFYRDNRVWLAGSNRCPETVLMHVQSFSVTWEADLGTVTPLTSV